MADHSACKPLASISLPVPSDGALQVEAHSSSSSSSSSSRTVTPVYQEPVDTIGQRQAPITMRSNKGTLPSQNGALRSKFIYRSPMEREVEELNRMIETPETIRNLPPTNRAISMEHMDRARIRSTSDTLPGIQESTLNWSDSPDYQWSPPAGRPLPYYLQSESNVQQHHNDIMQHHGEHATGRHRNERTYPLTGHHNGGIQHQDGTAQHNSDVIHHHSDVTRHHSDVTRHHNDVTQHHNDTTHHLGDNTLQHNSKHVLLSSDMPHPNSPPHDHLIPRSFNSDYPRSPSHLAPPFQPPPSVHNQPPPSVHHRDSPTASVSSFEYQCLSQFQLNRSRSHKHSRPQESGKQTQRSMHGAEHSNIVAPSSFSTAQAAGPTARKLTRTPKSRNHTAPFTHRQNPPTITQTPLGVAPLEQCPEDQPRMVANIHRRPTKLAEEEERRIAMEKINTKRQALYKAAVTGHKPSMMTPQYDDRDATFV